MGVAICHDGSALEKRQPALGIYVEAKLFLLYHGKQEKERGTERDKKERD